MASSASISEKCWITEYENTHRNKSDLKGKNLASPQTQAMFKFISEKALFAAKIAPSDGSIPTTRHPLRAADTDQRPQFDPTSSKNSPFPFPTGISGMG